MNKKKFYLYVQRYLLDFVVDLHVPTPLLKQFSIHSAKNQYNTSLNSFKLKILECKYSTKGIETLNYKKAFFVQDQYKLSKDLLCAPFLENLEIVVYSNYSVLHKLKRISLAQDLALLETKNYFSKFFYVNSRILYASPLIDLMTQLSSPKFFHYAEGFRLLSDTNYEESFVYKVQYFKSFVLRVAKDQVHQSLLNPCQKLFTQNQILLSCNFFLLFNLVKVSKKYKILPNQKIFAKKQGIRKIVILVRYWSQRDCKVLTLFKLTDVDKVMTNAFLLLKPFFSRKNGFESFWCLRGAKSITWCQVMLKHQHHGHQSYHQNRRELKGLKNLAPIKSVNLNYFQLLRPLVTLTRLDSFYICESLKLPIYPDKSNSQVKFLRNRVRKQLLPAIRILLNPQFDTLFCKFSESYTESKKQNSLSQI